MKDIVPKHIQFETVNGICTTRCTICTWKTWKRKPGIMSNDVYREILIKFVPYREHIRYITLHGCGEPLLDRGLAKKVAMAKELGFQGTGLATNCTELDEQKSRELLEAGLDTIICSIDGIKKDTHEAIRVGANFDRIVANVRNFIRLRNERGRTRIMVRFIRQEMNKPEWPLFADYWSKRLNKDYGDEVVKFDVHNWGEKVEDYRSLDPNRRRRIDSPICRDIFERMIIYFDGNVALCCADDNGFYDLGNALNSSPIKIYNNEIFKHYRETMLTGGILELEHCRRCTIRRSRGIKAKE